MNRLRQNRFARLFILLVVSAAVVLLLGIAVLTLPTATAASSAARPQLIITTTPSMTPTVTKTVTLTATVTMTMTVTPTTTTTLTPTVTITPTFVLSAAAYLPAVVIPQLTPTFTPSPTPSPTSPVGCLPNPPLGPSNSTVDAAVFERINQQRHNNGLPSYGDHTRLVQAARRHARDMADNDALSHTGSDGSTVPQRISEACYNAQFTSEIIGWGFPTVDDMMAWWLGSSTHRGAILHLSLQEMGVAYVRQAGSAFTHYWTVVFARPTSADNLDGMLFVCTETIAEPGRGMSVQWVQEWPCEK